MSFDLFVLLEKTDASTQLKWLEKLNETGVECKFPDGFSISTDCEGETLVECKLNPPLVKTPSEFETFEFYFEPSDIDNESLADMVESTNDEQLKQKLVQMKSEIQLSSSAGREDHALIVQCFAAATLADATDGILFDPQEFGVVYGNKVYQVANHHCQHVPDQGKATQEARLQSHHAASTNSAPIKEGMSPMLLILLCVLFMAIINVITK